jgi:lipoprotein-anchoring transpeptidase ErfK/SrfK
MERTRCTASTERTEPWTIGKNVSSGCIRMINQDVIDLYNRTAIGTRVVVVPANIG